MFVLKSLLGMAKKFVFVVIFVLAPPNVIAVVEPCTDRAYGLSEPLAKYSASSSFLFSLLPAHRPVENSLPSVHRQSRSGLAETSTRVPETKEADD